MKEKEPPKKKLNYCKNTNLVFDEDGLLRGYGKIINGQLYIYPLAKK